jgi:phosphate-selective porin
MSHKAFFFGTAVFAFFLFLGTTSVYAEMQALQKLLEVFEKKGALDPEEVRVIRQAINDDLREVSAQEKELEDREKRLEQREKELAERERSMGYFLTPRRDIGVMAHAALFDDRLDYGVGVFNGKGVDDSVGGDSDALQITRRLVLAPFRSLKTSLVEKLQFGASASTGKIDRNGVNIQVETTGMTTFLDVSPNAKFGISQDADRLDRYGMELAWTYGPFAIVSEYVANRYENIETSSNEFDLGLDSTSPFSG